MTDEELAKWLCDKFSIIRWENKVCNHEYWFDSARELRALAPRLCEIDVKKIMALQDEYRMTTEEYKALNTAKMDWGTLLNNRINNLCKAIAAADGVIVGMEDKKTGGSKMRKIELGTEKYTTVYATDEKEFNANHVYEIGKVGIQPEIDTFMVLQEIKFQKGPIKEVGINGVFNEDLIVIVIDRLQSFQESEYKCRENAIAITKLEEALLWLRKRTMDRERRGVEGTNEV